jgi:hypothetical protein
MPEIKRPIAPPTWCVPFARSRRRSVRSTGEVVIDFARAACDIECDRAGKVADIGSSVAARCNREGTAMGRGRGLRLWRGIAVMSVGVALIAVAGCAASFAPPLLHNSGEGVPGCHSHCIESTFSSPVGKRTALLLEPYVCTAAGPVHIDSVTLLEPTATARLDGWGFYNSGPGALLGEAHSLKRVYATSHVVSAPCSAKWQHSSILYVLVHRVGTAPAFFYGAQLHYRSFGHEKTETLDQGVEICAPHEHQPCPEPDQGP